MVVGKNITNAINAGLVTRLLQRGDGPSELIEELIHDGRVQPKKNVDSVTYHDPCYLARVNGITEAPRALLPDLTEMPRSRCQTACCGAGGGRMWFDDPAEERIGQSRITEALDTGAKTVAVSCPFCLTMMTDGITAKDDQVQVRDVAELMLEDN